MAHGPWPMPQDPGPMIQDPGPMLQPRVRGACHVTRPMSQLTLTWQISLR